MLQLPTVTGVAERLVNPETTVFSPAATEGLLRDNDASGGLNSSTLRGDDHLRLFKFVDDFLCRVSPFGHVSTPVLSGILTLIRGQLSGVKSPARELRLWQ